MANREFDLDKEPLWAIPAPVQERMQRGIENNDSSDYRNFLLSGLFCALALLFLLIFGGYALAVGETTHAVVLFVFAGITIVGYAAIWFGAWYSLAKHFTTVAMAALCLYLFYSGGLENTGPLYYFIFPSVALFLNGRLRGFIWVLALLLLTILFWKGMLGFDVQRYGDTFVSRVLAVSLVIAALACIPEYFRIEAERNFLLSISDMEALTYGDPRTKLANRNLLEKMLQLEFNRNQRYGSACCLMFVELDPVSKALTGLLTESHNRQMLTLLAETLRKILRVQDIAGCWENQRFLLILPESTLEGATLLAERLQNGVRVQGAGLPKTPLHLTLSIGITALDKSPAADVLERAINMLLTARRQGGNRYLTP
jgi:diguanylate cyclase (GGDEF)-like protein